MDYFGNRAGDPVMGLINYPTNASTFEAGAFQRTKEPLTCGTSVLGVKFNGGVAIAADSLGSYGSLARFRNVPRVFKVNQSTIMGVGGDYADLQYLKKIIDQKVLDDDIIDDGFHMKPKMLYSWLTRYLYGRRSQINPLWTDFVIGGVDNGEAFLGTVDMLGTAYKDELIATGFGTYLAVPHMRPVVAEANARGGLTEQEAIELMKKCIEILYYRDCKSWPKYQLGIITNDGTRIEELTVESNWDVALMVKGFE